MDTILEQANKVGQQASAQTGVPFAPYVPSAPSTPAPLPQDQSGVPMTKVGGQYVPGTGGVAGTYAGGTTGKFTPTEVKISETAKIPTAQDKLTSASDELDLEASKTREALNGIINGTFALSAGEQAQVQGLQQQFQQLIQQQQLSNKGSSGLGNIRGYQTGAGEYDPTFQAKVIGSIISAGNQKVADLNSKMAGAVAELTESFASKRFDRIKSAYDVYEKAKKDRIATLQKTVDDTNKAMEDARKARELANEKVLGKTVGSLVADEGLTDTASITKRLAQLGIDYTPKQLKDALDTFNPQGSGVIAEYNLYKKEAQQAGQQPMGFNDYQTMDANRKAKAAVDVGNLYGLDKEQRTRVAGLLDDYDKQVKDKKTVLSQSKQIDALSTLALSSNKDEGSRAAAQIGTIFSFMKMLDPSSTVREGEYATAQNTAGVDDKIRNAYNKAVNGSFLTDGQIKGYVATAKAVAESARRQVEDIDNEFDRRATIFGIPAGVISQKAEEVKESTPIKQEADAEVSIKNYTTNNPNKVAEVNKAIQSLEATLGRHATSLELLEAYPEFSQ